MFEMKLLKMKKEIKALRQENISLYSENKDIRFDLEILESYKNKNEKMHENIIKDLLDLQEINSLGIAEEEKNKHRNIIINKIVNELVTDSQSNN